MVKVQQASDAHRDSLSLPEVDIGRLEGRDANTILVLSELAN
jgi:hypothetical protein